MSAEFQVQMPAAIVQLEAYYAANWAVTDWYIDGTTGSDSNNGTSAATPLKTGQELRRRLGSHAEWSHSVTIHVLANGMIDPLVLRGCFTATYLHLDIIGTPTVLVSDVLSSYLPLSHATPRATEIVGTAITDFTPYVGQRVRMTSGLRVGFVTWIAKSNPNGVGVATARVSPGVNINTTSTSSIFLATEPVAGDSFVVESLPAIPQIVIDLDGSIAFPGTGAQWNKRMHSVQSIDCGDIVARSAGDNFPAYSTIFGCKVASVCTVLANGRESQFCVIMGCNLGPNSSGSTCILKSSILYCLVSASVGMTLRTYQIQYSLLQGASVTIYCPEAFLGQVQIFDTTSTFGAVYILGSAVLSTVSGDQNTYGIVLQSGARLSYNKTGALNLKGSTSDCRLPSTPPINLTQVQFKQPNDYAQSGVATLVAGTVTVTVPWYENTIQRVTLTRATAGGTIGDLSVSQISNSQFTITSASALDTSSVNWAISPLGRDVHVAGY